MLFLATTVVTALNTVYFKRMLNCYRGIPGEGQEHDYAVFVSVFDILLWAVLMSAVAHIGGWKVSAARFRRRAVLRVAVVDQLGTLLATLGAPYVPGQVQVLLNQAVLPITMLLTSAGGRRHSVAEVVGASLVLAGATVAAGVSSCWAHGAEALQSGTLFFLAAQLAVAVAGILKESLLRKASWTLPGKEANDPPTEQPVADSIALGVTTAWLRVPFGVILALGLRISHGDSVLSEFWDGWRCFVGRQPRPGDEGCPQAAPTTLLSVVLYAGQTLLGLRLTQCGSATLRSIAAVTAVPLASALFTSPALMTGAGAEAYSGSSASGLALCLLGFAVYIKGQRREHVAR